ncbi:hypothetical protein C1645_821404 [Glomus cerebriforme]|uniref:Uncharacterized protein n=1 Tax=Glomus cerebriforme TaxID=658196 RepID=A0A397T3D2_9GLOM|nr:hypothetical protein C1645_821404 [Glomus cerebriforme]
MSAIVTKYVAEHKLSKDMSNEELSQHASELLELLTDKLKRDKGRQRFQKGYNFSREQAFVLVPNQRICRKVKVIAKALTVTSSNPVATTSRLSRLRRELREFNAPEKIISVTLDDKTTCVSNKIQKERRVQRENEGIDFPDHFSLESVKEKLDLYDVSKTPDVQVLADVMIMLCIRPAKIKDLRISNGKRDEERAKLLLTWIQNAISSE